VARFVTGLPAPLPVLAGPHPGWLHLPPPGPALLRGVLVCGTLGHEALASHRGLVALAAACAAAGLPALRFDYPATGEAEEEEVTGLVPAAIRSIGQAAAWMRRELGVAEVALCGFRLGAALAAEHAAAAPAGIAALAMIAPVVSGKAHARRLHLASEAAGQGNATWLECGGERLHRGELAALARIELPAALRAARLPRLLLLDDRTEWAALADLPGLQAAPMPVQEGFLAQAHAARLPLARLRWLADWLAEGATAGMPRRPEQAAPRALAGAIERTLRLGPRQELAASFCAPAWQRRGTAVLLLNNGANPRAGIGRQGVRLARRLARAGFASLRLDLGGIGDSLPPEEVDAAAPPDLFHPARIAEARLGLELLAAHGAQRCLVAGICSGAHVALQLALADARVQGLALVNLPAFDRSQGGAPALDGGPPPGEAPWLRRPRMLLRRLRAEADWMLAGCGVEAGLDRPARWMRDLAARGAPVLLAYSQRDRGLRELRAHFGRGGRRLAALPGATIAMLPGTDHAVAPRAMQARLADLVLQAALLLDQPPAARAALPEAPAAAARIALRRPVETA
jgi:pimeloyl-ACP methyl ester carboxylesterase